MIQSTGFIYIARHEKNAAIGRTSSTEWIQIIRILSRKNIIEINYFKSEDQIIYKKAAYVENGTLISIQRNISVSLRIEKDFDGKVFDYVHDFNQSICRLDQSTKVS